MSDRTKEEAYGRRKALIGHAVRDALARPSSRRLGILVAGLLAVEATYQLKSVLGWDWLQIPLVLLAMLVIAYFLYAFVQGVRELLRNNDHDETRRT